MAAQAAGLPLGTDQHGSQAQVRHCREVAAQWGRLVLGPGFSLRNSRAGASEETPAELLS